MKTTIFALATDDQLAPLGKRRAVEVLLARREAGRFGCAAGLRLVSVVSNEQLQPILIFLIRVRLVDGRTDKFALDEASRAALALPGEAPALFGELVVHPASDNVADLTEVLFQLSGWPSVVDLRRQLAVALDVPYSELPNFRLGGPLLELASSATRGRAALPELGGQS